MNFTSLLLIFSFCVSWNEAANILAYIPSASRSHAKPFFPLFMALAKRGHNVTVVSMFPPEEKNQNYTHLQVGDEFQIPGTGFAFLRQQTRVENYLFMHKLVQILTIKLIGEQNLRRLMQSDSTKFDLIMIEIYHTDTFLALGNHFKAPTIGLSFQSIIPVYNWILKNPCNFATTPHLYTPFSDTMDFSQRLANTLFGVFSIIFYNFVSLSTYQRQIDSLMESMNIKEVPRIEEITKNLSLVLVESHFSVGYAKPHLPNVVEVAGIHIPPHATLPQDIAEFIDKAEKGFIYISMGTLVTPATMYHLGKKLRSIFEKFPYSVIMKWNPKLIPSTSKLLIREWLPQTDILNHPKIVLFVSHGGYHSIIETVDAGVPILCLPFFTDQHYNAAIVEKLAFGKKVDLEASEKELFDNVKALIDDERYRKNAKQRSKIFKDRPTSPLDLAVYWTEYVIRYEGAPHLRSAAIELSWYQYLLLDVILIILVVLFVSFYVTKRGVIILYNFIKLRNRSNKVKTN